MATTHEAHPGTVLLKALAGSSVWWPGTDSELGEAGSGGTHPLPAVWHHLSLKLAVPGVVTKKHGRDSTVTEPDTLRERASGLWSTPSLKGAESSYFHLEHCPLFSWMVIYITFQTCVALES